MSQNKLQLELKNGVLMKVQTLALVLDNGNNAPKIYGDFPGNSIVMRSLIHFVDNPKQAIDGFNPVVFRYAEGSSKFLKGKNWIAGEHARFSNDYERVSDDDLNKAQYALPLLLSSLIDSGVLVSNHINIVCMASCHDLAGVGEKLMTSLAGADRKGTVHKVSKGATDYTFKIMCPTQGVVSEGAAVVAPQGLSAVLDFGHKTVMHRIFYNGAEVGQVDYEMRGVMFLHQMIAESNELRSLLHRKGDPDKVNDAIRNCKIERTTEMKPKKQRDASNKVIKDVDGKALIEMDSEGKPVMEAVETVRYSMAYKAQSGEVDIFPIYKAYFPQWVKSATRTAFQRINNLPYDDKCEIYAIGGGCNLPLMLDGLNKLGVQRMSGDPQLMNAKTIYERLLKPAISKESFDFSKVASLNDVGQMSRQPKVKADVSQAVGA